MKNIILILIIFWIPNMGCNAQLKQEYSFTFSSDNDGGLSTDIIFYKNGQYEILLVDHTYDIESVLHVSMGHYNAGNHYVKLTDDYLKSTINN